MKRVSVDDRSSQNDAVERQRITLGFVDIRGRAFEFNAGRMPSSTSVHFIILLFVGFTSCSKVCKNSTFYLPSEFRFDSEKV